MPCWAGYKQLRASLGPSRIATAPKLLDVRIMDAGCSWAVCLPSWEGASNTEHHRSPQGLHQVLKLHQLPKLNAAAEQVMPGS